LEQAVNSMKVMMEICMVSNLDLIPAMGILIFLYIFILVIAFGTNEPLTQWILGGCFPLDECSWECN